MRAAVEKGGLFLCIQNCFFHDSLFAAMGSPRGVPQDVPTFWQHWGELFAESPSRAVLATNNLILSEQRLGPRGPSSRGLHPPPGFRLWWWKEAGTAESLDTSPVEAPEPAAVKSQPVALMVSLQRAL